MFFTTPESGNHDSNCCFPPTSSFFCASANNNTENTDSLTDQTDGDTTSSGRDPFYETLTGQMIATIGLGVASILTLISLFGEREKHDHPVPCKDYSYLDSFPRASTLLLLAATLYFVYVAYLETKYKDSAGYYWILFANLLVAAAAIIKVAESFSATSDEEIIEAAE